MRMFLHIFCTHASIVHLLIVRVVIFIIFLCLLFDTVFVLSRGASVSQRGNVETEGASFFTHLACKQVRACASCRSFIHVHLSNHRLSHTHKESSMGLCVCVYVRACVHSGCWCFFGPRVTLVSTHTDALTCLGAHI